MNPVRFKASETEGAVERLVSTQNGSTKTIGDAIDMILASHHDAVSRDESIVDTLRTMMRKSDANTKRIESLENVGEDCAERVRSLIREEHEMRHDKHLESHHPPRREADPVGAEFTDVREYEFGDGKTLSEVVAGWRFVKYIVGIIIVVAVGWVLPFWADSCASSKAEKAATHYEVVPTTVPTTLP